MTNGQDGNHELREVIIPVKSIEVEFYDTEAGSKWILANLQHIGETMAKSMVDIFNLKLLPVSPSIPEDDFYFVKTGANKTLSEAELEAKKVATLTKQEVGINNYIFLTLKCVKRIK